MPPTPDELTLRARLFLVAPATVARSFDELARAWKILCWNLEQNGPVDMIDKQAIYFAKPDDEDVVRVKHALIWLKSSIRPKALGAIRLVGEGD